MINKKRLNEWIIPFLIALVVVIIIRSFLGFIITIPTNSMYPQIHKNETFWVSKLKGKLERGDIVVFKKGKLLLVKRTIGLPGENVKIKNDKIYINDIEIEEPYVLNTGGKEGVFNVPKDCYLFLGDNRADSNDSRYWDDPYVSRSSIKGKIKYRLLPLKKVGELNNLQY